MSAQRVLKLSPLACILSNMRSELLRVETTGSWPSPAQDYYDGPISLDRHLVAHPQATFVLRVASDSLTTAGIHAGDELVVDRSIDPRRGHVLVVVVDGELRLGVFDVIEGQATLVAGNATIPLTAQIRPWGVATVAIRHLPGGPPVVPPRSRP